MRTRISSLITLLIITTLITQIITTNLEQSSSYTLLGSIRRNRRLYTQGMFFSDDGKNLIESTGLYGKSALAALTWPTLNLVKYTTLSPNLFAEGVARCGNFVYMLTWKERSVLKFDWPSLDYVDTIGMPQQLREGWGLANTGTNQMIVSDGSSNIYVLDCSDSEDLKVTSTLRVTIGNQRLSQINALEFANGYIWANVYFSNNIYKIDPTTGRVLVTYDMTRLVNNELRGGLLTNTMLNQGYVLNGIAYNPVLRYFIVTGKGWGNYYRINFR
jgi:glutaminyl-peptide cyclotransferase